VLAFARDMVKVASSVAMPHTGEPVRIRIGIHTGPVMSGVVGSKLPKFGLFGDRWVPAACCSVFPSSQHHTNPCS
jgi:class 3 adenylate cyclase